MLCMTKAPGPSDVPGVCRLTSVATIAAMRRMPVSSSLTAFCRSLPLSSVTLELRNLGLNRLSRLEPKPPVIRYEPKAPGDMIHLDIKKLGRIDGVGKRIHGDRSRRGRSAGWGFLTCARAATAAWLRPRPDPGRTTCGSSFCACPAGPPLELL